jgi:hypothetical protein
MFSMTLPVDRKHIQELRKQILEDMNRVEEQKRQLLLMIRVLQETCSPYHRYDPNGSDNCLNCGFSR